MTDPIFGDPIHTYTRAQAIEDGDLVLIEREESIALFRHPVCFTRALWNHVEVPKGMEGMQDLKGRQWDVLWLAHLAAKCGKATDIVPFKVIMAKLGAKKQWLQPTLKLRIHVGPGDTPEPVITIGFPEDF